MDKDKYVNGIVRDMVKFKIICEDKEEEARVFLNNMAVALLEQGKKELLAHNKRKVIQYDRDDQEIGRFDTIKEAARYNGCSRDVVDDSVSGRVKISKKTGYFRYADNEDTGRSDMGE